MEAMACAVLLGGASAGGLAVYEALRRVSAPPQRPEAGHGEANSAFGAGTGAGPRVAAGAGTWLPGGLLGSVAARATRVVERAAPLDRDGADRLRDRLSRAGCAVAPETWRGVQAIAALLGASACAAGAWWAASPAAMLPGALIGVAVGIGLTELWLARRRRRRIADIEAGLPDAMELLGVALAAGSPVEQCFREVAQSMEGPLSDELATVDQEVNLLGRSRAEALSHLAQRCASPQVSAFSAHIVQAIEQGSSIAEGLALQAQLARETAQADALERIRKMPTKLDVVLSVCFLPPTVALVLVPTVMSLLAFLSDSMG